ncbi:MAG: hypothetical protein J6Q72_05115 [Clostridia bacterium]|nr:hypothetical protein [Clostridia bacterium]MBO5914709.1 hypothetical protein [Clostridia bacterium]
MDYREQAKDLLKRKNALVNAYAAIREELGALEDERASCKSAIARAREQGREYTVFEDRLINILAELEDCRFRKSVVERELNKIERGMNALDEYERDLLEGFFCTPCAKISEYLMAKYYKERATLYRDKLNALELFTRSVYGLVQL